MKPIGKYTSIQNTKRLDKPNEDYCVCDNINGIYIVLDGVSRDAINGKYPVPSPARIVSELFANKTYEYLLNALHNSDDCVSKIINAIAYGNEHVCAFNANEHYDFLPGTVGIIALIRDGTISYGFIGDCFGRLLYPNSSYIFTRCQTEYVHNHISKYSTFEIRNIICNNASHPAGYGVINGQNAAIDFVEANEFVLLPTQKVILSTDGAEKFINTLTPLELYNITIEQADILIRKHYSDNADDRTLMIISLKE